METGKMGFQSTSFRDICWQNRSPLGQNSHGLEVGGCWRWESYDPSTKTWTDSWQRWRAPAALGSPVPTEGRQHSISLAFPEARRAWVSHDRHSRPSGALGRGRALGKRALGRDPRLAGQPRRGRKSGAGTNPSARRVAERLRDALAAATGPALRGGQASPGGLPKEDRRSGSPARSLLSGAPDSRETNLHREARAGVTAKASPPQGLLGSAERRGRRLHRAKSSPGSLGTVTYTHRRAPSE